MEERKFRLWNHIVAVAVLVVASFTYLSTIEPTASFWDCGEFIASSYKLEVGHPPGNPVFQLVARFFTIFTSPDNAALAVNAMSAMCSAFTIFFLYLTIVFLAKRLVKPGLDGRYTAAQAIAVFGSGAVGALAYCFSDTFWFSAVEAEVYAMSSLFTAMVFWAMTKWYEQADKPYANRWIVLISFLMGLSIGVHLLNLLCIPCIVFLYYYKKREDGHYTFWEYVKIFLISVVLIAIILFFIVPYLPKFAAYTDIFFVNTLGLPVNSGAAFFVIALLALCFWGIIKTYNLGKVFWNTVLLCFTTIAIGFSVFSVVIIRSSVMPPTNENQPDNAFSLVRYLSREQYGKTPLIYGQYFGGAIEKLYTPQYWVLLNGEYRKADAPVDAEYTSASKMLFPRMWSNQSDSHTSFYQSYMGGRGSLVAGSKYRKPTFGTNLRFFFDYQMNWMYWRYFMWNFVGRQNDIHSPVPGDIFYGNWESGIGFIDEIRLGDQSNAPSILAENKGKNHYFFLPLILGLIGLFFQFDKDKRGCWLTFLLFFMTGIAIVIYLNQPPYQVRERDYAYAGSFYAFSIWIGLAVTALSDWAQRTFKGKNAVAFASVFTAACLFVPGLMAQQNWDDHDRSNRRTAVEMASNHLNAVGEQGILVTHGDNDTFPLWYAQEVEGIRTDVRICNTSLLGTDWYINQMKYAINDSKPLPVSIPAQQYLYGTNDYVIVYDTRNQVIPLADVMAVFKHPDAKVTMENGDRQDYIMSRKVSIPVNVDNVIKYGILPEEFRDNIPSEIVLEIKGDMISKVDLFMLDLLSNYQWDRQINLLNNGGDLQMGIKDYLMYEGYSYKFVPIKNRVGSTDIGLVNAGLLYDNVMNKMAWDEIKRDDYFVDYQNLYTFLGVLPVREVFSKTANALIAAGDTARAVEVLDRCQEVFPEKNYPLESICIGFYGNDVYVIDMVSAYYMAGEPEKARDLAARYTDELMKSTQFFLDFYDYAQQDFEYCGNCIYMLADTIRTHGDKELAEDLLGRLEDMLRVAVGELPEDDETEIQTEG